ncbi:hypothetical protein FA95DRAFT_721200 [Auriscalpium vulgare]|uniref:Uncharacterized protein n=1 Tax=Auriscalpium vulgare TaxID=40419 RepID=A0ACB8SA46_9AGAM|nr:hypothetical protein FA95DRAFT_721200 [Auriscalpium vulgare]
MQPLHLATSLPPVPRRKGPPASLRIDTPSLNPSLALARGDSSASSSAISPATSESGSFQFPPPSSKPRSLRNMKRLSLTLPSAQSSTSSLAIPPPELQSTRPEQPAPERPRRPSVASLAPSNSSILLRKEEDGSPSVPYVDGPIEIIPRIWLGAEDNVHNWQSLAERSIGAVLNVAKEVASPFDSILDQRPQHPDTYYAADTTEGRKRPGMHYLKLHWSHGQSDLVQCGFPEAMAFVDRSLERGEGVLIHCQCGISRSATMVIALVMRAAATHSLAVPPEVWELKGMQAAYAYVKEKSKWVGPNMSLIYQLLEYERVLRGDRSSPEPSSNDAEEEWGRRRQMLEETPNRDDTELESSEVQREARALDKAMEDRIVARKASASSLGSGRGMGTAWRNRYSSRKRTGSIASNLTSNSVISEDLVEEDEEQDLLGVGVGGGFDRTSIDTTSPKPAEDMVSDASSEHDVAGPEQSTPLPPRRVPQFARVPPSAPASKSTFTLPPVPATAFRATFDLPSRLPLSKPKKRRPPPLGGLPPVPDSPSLVIEVTSPPPAPPLALPPRKRTESRKPALPPLALRKSSGTRSLSVSSTASTSSITVSTPSQTLFVFPPSPTTNTFSRTPSAMTLTSSISLAFPTISTPRVSTFRNQGRSKSFIGLMAPPTPTTAHARVDARGWVGMH